MDIKALESELKALITLKNQLAATPYNDATYDELEEKLHDREDDFIEKYGEYLEDAFHDVHDELCPDSEVLLPIAYLANKYSVDESGEYDIPVGEGVFVEMDDYSGQDTRLALLPNPVRIMLIINGKDKQIVWSAE